MNRGQYTQEIGKKYGIGKEELRLLPYFQYLLINHMPVDPNKINETERSILQKWRNENKITFSSTEPCTCTRTFWDWMNNILWDSYVPKDDSNPTKILALTIIRNRPCENEQWAEIIGLEYHTDEDLKPDIKQVLIKRIQNILATKTGWKLNYEACCDFNWGDFMMNIKAFESQGIIEDPHQAERYETISVNTDEVLSTFEIDATLRTYDIHNMPFKEFPVTVDMETGTIALKNFDDEQFIEDKYDKFVFADILTKNNEVLQADLGNMTLDKN